MLPNTVIDVWKGGWEAEMNKVTAGGLHAVLSTCWYLNYISYGEDWKRVSTGIGIRTGGYGPLFEDCSKMNNDL